MGLSTLGANIERVAQKAFAASKLLLRVSLLLFVVALPLLSCASNPTPEGADFLSESSGSSQNENLRGTAYVNPNASKKIYRKVAVMPFRAPMELAGASVADTFSTELLKTYRYELVERSQMEQVLGEQALGLKGVTENALAIRVGKLLNVSGVIVGTVPEYGMRAVGGNELPAIGINIRMIDVETGSIIWTVSDSAIADKPISISAFTRRLVKSMMARLAQEWKAAGDTFSINLPAPQVVSWKGGLRSATIEIVPSATKRFVGYNISRSHAKGGPYEKIRAVKYQKNKIVVNDKNLIDAETYYYKVGGISKNGLTGPPAGPLKITTVGPPSPVMQVTAKSNIARKVPLTWTPVNEPEVKGYAIFRADSKKGPFKEIKFISGKEKNSYVDTGKGGGGFFSNGGGLADYTEYFYRVQTVNVVDVRGQHSPVATAKTKPVPNQVAGFEASEGEVKQVTLVWQPNPEKDIKKYKIYRGNGEGPLDKNIKNLAGNKTRYIDDGLKDGKTYYYKIRAVDKDQLESEFSEVISSATKPVPVKPSGLSADYDGGGINLHWDTNPENDIKIYQVFMQSFFWKKLGDTHDESFVYRGKIKKGETLTFRIKAVDATNLESEPSEKVDVVIPE